MKVKKTYEFKNIDLAIVGLGYESRATQLCCDVSGLENIIAIGYEENKTAFSYSDNLNFYKSKNAVIFEGSDSNVYHELFTHLQVNWLDRPINCVLDISVMSRTRLAEIILFLISNLHPSSSIKITYQLAEFTNPPKDISPIRKVGPIARRLGGRIGNIELPSSIIIGLGYELGNAIGICNYLDSDIQFLFIPKGKDEKFEDCVRANNETLIESTPANHLFSYDVSQPYKTYLQLREIALAALDISRPVMVPLGPKIFSALCVVLGCELNYTLPVWRVSSEHNEKPVDRRPSGNRYEFVVEL